MSLRTAGEHRLRVVAHDDLAGDGRVLAQPVPRWRGATWPATRRTTWGRRPSSTAPTSNRRSGPTLDLATGAVEDVLRSEAPGHDPAAYVTERMAFAGAGRDVRRGDRGPAPGHPARRDRARAALRVRRLRGRLDEPEWDPALPSLLDRGVVFAHAHIRGGGEGGRRWWLDGRLEHKQHTFDDHIAVADGLAGLVDGSRIASRGLSAGGLLQGAVFSQRPDRWRAVLAEVPFVDVVTTMFDASIPLTITEWDEWGDPRRKEDFDFMLAYSPYDHLPPAGGRPDLLVDRCGPRPPGDGARAREVGGRAARTATRSGRRAACSGASSGPVRTSARRVGSGTSRYEAEVAAWLLDRLGVGG